MATTALKIIKINLEDYKTLKEAYPDAAEIKGKLYTWDPDAVYINPNTFQRLDTQDGNIATLATLIDTAQSAAETAQHTAETATAAANAAEATAKTATATAATAESTAATAQETAKAATKTAETATAAANAAVSVAATAKDTANTATEAAATAQSLAAEAKSVADTCAKTAEVADLAAKVTQNSADINSQSASINGISVKIQQSTVKSMDLMRQAVEAAYPEGSVDDEVRTKILSDMSTIIEDAEAEVTTSGELAASSKGLANASASLAANARVAADAAQKSATDAYNYAKDAEGHANDAKTAAEKAQGNAESAAGSAQQAIASAGEAVSAAEAATTNANTAYDNAIQAKKDCEEASGYATEAKEAAEKATTAAKQATESANDAATNANDAASKASGSILWVRFATSANPASVDDTLTTFDDSHRYMGRCQADSDPALDETPNLDAYKPWTKMNGDDGLSTVSLDISNDFDSVPASSDGTVGTYDWEGQTKHEIHVLYGTEKKNFTVSTTAPTSGNEYVLVYKNTGFTTVHITPSDSSSASSATVWVEGFDSCDKATMEYSVYYGTTLMASGKFEADKVKAGAQGEKGNDATDYYLLSDPSVIQVDKDNNITSSITFTAYSKTGTANPSTYTGYITYQVDSDTVQSTTANTLTLTTAGGNYSADNSKITVKLYSNSDHSVLLDSETVAIVADGTNGRSLTNTTVTYAQTETYTKPETIAESDWKETLDSVTDGYYVYTRTKLEYSSGNPTYSYSTSRDPKDGTAGRGISGTVINYGYSTSATDTSTVTWTGTTIPTVDQGSYLWTRTTTSYTSGSDSVSYSVARQGSNGGTGASGASVKSYYTEYTQNSDYSKTPSSGWSTTIPAYNSAKPYYWKREVATLNDAAETKITSTPELAKSMNVDFLNTLGLTAKKITVQDSSENTVFDADGDAETVTMGGFTVTADSLLTQQPNQSTTDPTGSNPTAYDYSGELLANTANGSSGVSGIINHNWAGTDEEDWIASDLTLTDEIVRTAGLPIFVENETSAEYLSMIMSLTSTTSGYSGYTSASGAFKTDNTHYLTLTFTKVGSTDKLYVRAAYSFTVSTVDSATTAETFYAALGQATYSSKPTSAPFLADEILFSTVKSDSTTIARGLLGLAASKNSGSTTGAMVAYRWVYNSSSGWTATVITDGVKITNNSLQILEISKDNTNWYQADSSLCSIMTYNSTSKTWATRSPDSTLSTGTAFKLRTNFTQVHRGPWLFALKDTFAVSANGKTYCDKLVANDINVSSGSANLTGGSIGDIAICNTGLTSDYLALNAEKLTLYTKNNVCGQIITDGGALSISGKTTTTDGFISSGNGGGFRFTKESAGATNSYKLNASLVSTTYVDGTGATCSSAITAKYAKWGIQYWLTSTSGTAISGTVTTEQDISVDLVIHTQGTAVSAKLTIDSGTSFTSSDSGTSSTKIFYVVSAAHAFWPWDVANLTYTDWSFVKTNAKTIIVETASGSTNLRPIYAQGSIYPDTNSAKHDLGASNSKWNAIYGTTITGGTVSGDIVSGTTVKGLTINGTTITGTTINGTTINYDTLNKSSDRRLKNNIVNLSDETLIDTYTALFDNLTPVTYKYNNDQTNLTRIGFIAQDTDKAIKTAGFDNNSMAMVMHDETTDTYSMSYEDIIALNTMQIQTLKKQITELKAEIAQLKDTK